jgi:predicted nucleic acid-binding protein
VIVTNTTPLSCLLKIGKADLLHKLYGTIAIPPEVAAELDDAAPIH